MELSPVYLSVVLTQTIHYALLIPCIFYLFWCVGKIFRTGVCFLGTPLPSFRQFPRKPLRDPRAVLYEFVSFLSMPLLNRCKPARVRLKSDQHGLSSSRGMRLQRRSHKYGPALELWNTLDGWQGGALRPADTAVVCVAFIVPSAIS
jgi:hypothetical protein